MGGKALDVRDLTRILDIQVGKVLMPGTYDELKGNPKGEPFLTGRPLALCWDRNQLIAVKLKLHLEQAKDPSDIYSESSYSVNTKACQAVAFFLDTPGLRAGARVESARVTRPTHPAQHPRVQLEQQVFQFRGHAYSLHLVDNNPPLPADKQTTNSLPRLELLQEGHFAATILKFGPETWLSCDPDIWLGDLNGDGLPDVAFHCSEGDQIDWDGFSISDGDLATRRLLVEPRFWSVL
jgi:hypothetical protein